MERQLSFAIDSPETTREEPLSATIAISGKLRTESNLYRRQRVRVAVMDEDGELLATGIATVRGIAFPFHERDGIETTERAHKLKLDVPA